MRVNQNGGLIFEKYMSAQNFRILVTGAGMGVIRDRLEKYMMGVCIMEF